LNFITARSFFAASAALLKDGVTLLLSVMRQRTAINSSKLFMMFIFSPVVNLSNRFRDNQYLSATHVPTEHLLFAVSYMKGTQPEKWLVRKLSQGSERKIAIERRESPRIALE
jgi:hypothetical protein